MPRSSIFLLIFCLLIVSNTEKEGLNFPNIMVNLSISPFSLLMLACIYLRVCFMVQKLPTWLSGKESACNAGDMKDTGLIPGSEISPGVGNGSLL